MLIWIISACGIEPTVTRPTDPAVESPVPTSTMTPFPPTATPIPMAVIINGVGISLEEFEAELNRFYSAHESDTPIDQQEAEAIVLEDMISQILLEQGAEEMGFEVTEAVLDARASGLIAAVGGEALFNQWLLENGYTQEDFRIVLERSIKAAWMRDQILAEVPRAAEHVHLRQILLFDVDQANQVYTELESGRDFATLAAIYDPVTQGDLGWIPRNYLPHVLIEEIAFSLQPGEYSQVIETSVGFHVIQVISFDEDRPLGPEARIIWQELALRDWVTQRREVSNIELLATE